jgi:hypothetical protein
MCTLPFCLIDFFLADLLSDGSHETLGVMRTVAPAAASFLAIREIRNKKRGRRITFPGAFAASMATSIAVSVVFAGYTYWTLPPDMGVEVLEPFLLSYLLIGCVSSVALSAALRR